ncbi:helix-turn-helix domain-containing protein [Hellea balneolensis]|uniref:helix-turn-helix domain-containing protein n=1 Tax=Hellea balneolensis TaxID=287478 RepID=UPI00041AADD4|nr:helix-turn-helix domain-containing protein [Hellea balneolensis]
MVLDIKHIGTELRDARQALGLSYADLSDMTRIKPQFLEAIESLSSADLPSIGYVLGYVRSYAKAVGFDGASAVARYKVDSQVPENLGMRDRPHFVPQRKIRLPRGFFSAVTVLAVAGMLTVWYGTQTETRAAMLNGPDLTPSATESQTAIIDPNMLTVKALAPSWVQIKDESGRVIISRIFVTGEVWQTQRGSGASISARDGGAIQLYVGEGDAGLLGERGVAVSNVPLAQ